jgi:hypothetical protein
LLKKNARKPSGTEIEYPMSDSMVSALNKTLKIFSDMKLTPEDVFLLGINITDIAVESLIQSGVITELDVNRLFDLIMLSKTKGLEEKALLSDLNNEIQKADGKEKNDVYLVNRSWGRKKSESNDSEFN